MNSSQRFIEIIKGLDVDSHGPNGLWVLNYAQWGNSYFFAGHTFSYWYEGVMPNNVKCLEEIQQQIIDYVEQLGQEKFEQGGWLAQLEIEDFNIKVFFQVAGGPGSRPPWN